MTIRAKFAGTCARCRERFFQGELIEWRPGEKARHTRPCAMAARPASFDAPPAPRLGVDEVGVYVLPDGTIAKVQANRAKTRTYALRWTEIGGKRMTDSGEYVNGDFGYEPGLVARVASEGRKMTLAEAQAFIIRYGQCVRCGRHLKAAESVELGLGPVCIKYFGAGMTGAGLMTGAAA